MPNNSKNAFLGQSRTRLRYLGTHLAPRHKKSHQKLVLSATWVAGVTGLEPAASGVTGRRSNQLRYTPERGVVLWWNKPL